MERLPRAFLRRYEELIKKRQAETLTEAEYAELLQHGDQTEAFAVRRVTALVALTELRHTDIDTLMRELDIKPEPLDIGTRMMRIDCTMIQPRQSD